MLQTRAQGVRSTVIESVLRRALSGCDRDDDCTMAVTDDLDPSLGRGGMNAISARRTGDDGMLGTSRYFAGRTEQVLDMQRFPQVLRLMNQLSWSKLCHSRTEILGLLVCTSSQQRTTCFSWSRIADGLERHVSLA